ncbi:hypothetical protein ALI22I_17500 [Saccharothrix sp. ALI-22-I]|nr:hypothetical protein ALI22I_17500 [Saccharothrix sp. ALI-22-I]
MTPPRALGAEGITYDIGFTPGGRSSRPVFDVDAVRREIRVIADDLHCDAVRITGGAPEALARLAELPARLDAVLADTAAAVRERFRGKVTYAAGTWEQIDWAPFDIVSVDAYGDAGDAFRQGVRDYLRHGKPLAATEFGCCTYRGAAERGGMGWDIVDYEADPPRLDGDYTRDEDEQARYLREMLAVFDEEGVDTAFWFTFAGYEFPHHTDPRFDLDMASYGVCKLMPDGSLAPKRSFHAMAKAYR